MNFKYLISDMDGVLLDSEKLILEMYIKASDILGFKFPEAEFYKTIGRDAKDTKVILSKHVPIDFEKLYSKREELLADYFIKNGPPVKPNVFEGLEMIRKAGLKTALATSTSKERAIFRLGKNPLLSYFDESVFGDEVEKGKPEPDIFLYAARLLGANPQECVVFEDSPAGIASAKSAGMHTVFIPDLQPPDKKLKELPDFTAKSFLEAVNYVLS